MTQGGFRMARRVKDYGRRGNGSRNLARSNE
jgi:hypothetical protein